MRTSATEIDAFLYWRNPPPHVEIDDEAAELAKLIAQLRKEGEANWNMQCGHALHAALEHATDGEFDTLEAEGFTFRFPTDLAIELPEIREVKGERVYVIDGVPITLVCKVDTLEGLRVEDHKGTFRFDAERFMSSFQWRAYLDVFDADHFRWNVFELFQGRDMEANEVEVRALHFINQYRYPELQADVERALRDFLDFARVHLPERFAAEAAA